MFGLSRKKTAPVEKHLDATPAAAGDVPESLRDSLRTLEIATLIFDAIAHSLTEARALSRSAARPDGSSQRGLIAARYAFLKEEIERRSAESAVCQGDRIAIAFGLEGERCADLIARDLPCCDFKTADEARALSQVIDTALHDIEEKAACVRETAGHIADRLAAMPAAESPSETGPETTAAPKPAKPASGHRRRAA